MQRQAERERTFLDYLQIARRRRTQLWTGCAAVFVPAALVALLWPPLYRSTGTILIEQQQVPQDLVPSTITSFAAERIQLIKQRVMTTANLLRIIRDHKLYADKIDREPRETIIERMRDDVHVDVISADVVDPKSGRPVEATIAFTVGYDNRSPEVAATVANQLASLFLQENSETRRQQAAEASNFLDAEAKRLSGRIDGLESRLADFKQKNLYRLPQLQQLNMQLMNRTELDLDDVQRQRATLEENRIFLEGQLAQLSPAKDLGTVDGRIVLSPEDRLKALEDYLVSVKGIYSDSHPDVVRTRKAIAALRKEVGRGAGDLGSDAAPREDLAAELEAAKDERDRLLESYSPKHPDVVRVEARIRELEGRLRAPPEQTSSRTAPDRTAPDRTALERAAPATSDATSTESPAAPAARTARGAAPGRQADAPPALGDEDADNPAYLTVQAQLKSTLMNVRALNDKEADLRRRLADYESRLKESPMVESEYDELTRDLDNARLQYRQIRANGMQAKVAQNLEDESKGEHFTLIEPPLVPERPVAPNRALIVILGLLLSLGAGVGLAAAAEALDTSIHGAADLLALTRVSPLGIIPSIVTEQERRTRVRWRWRFAAATAVAVVAVLLLVHLFVRPLDILWFAELRRLGV